MYPDQIKYLKKFILKHYKEYKNNTGDLWIKLHEFFYNGKYQDELKEQYKKTQKNNQFIRNTVIKIKFKKPSKFKKSFKTNQKNGSKY